jgi:Flp pilus assembly protein TadG
MRTSRRLPRQRGQVAIIMAFSFVALLGMVGTGIDLGLGYAHRREVQNAADSAAVAGALALGRHYQFTQIGAGYTLNPPLTDTTDSMINQEIQYAAAAGVPEYPDPATLPSWPTGTGNTLTANYLLTDQANPPNITVGAAVGSGGPPATAAGVRVIAKLQYDTIFARVLGACCTTFSVTGQSDAQLRPLGNTDAGAPFIVCGYSPVDGGGAWEVAPVAQTKVNILTAATPTAVNLATYSGATFRVHDEQLGKAAGPQSHDADCDAGNNYKGNSDPTDTCDAATTTGPLPCWLKGQNGTRAGPTRNRVAALPGCSGPTAADSCIIPLPIADGYNDGSSSLHVVTWACFRISQIDANSHNGTLLGACMFDGTAGSGAFNPNNPGAFTVKLTPQ